ncbi:MutH/Sau3AI family endonuclease, partial [Schleiferiaceae bacterium]|nr:MutH/Sau3AI family endonuclease [Schleiferiaceae bacterium]
MDRFYSSEDELLFQGKKILGSALFDLYGGQSVAKANEANGKGAYGNIVEELHYGIINNNRALPDVENLGVEIKTNPLKQNQDGTFVPKEVVSLGMIDFSTLVNEDFDSSAFIKKNQNILYNMYWHEKSQEIYNYKIALVDLIKLS